MTTFDNNDFDYFLQFPVLFVVFNYTPLLLLKLICFDFWDNKFWALLLLFERIQI